MFKGLTKSTAAVENESKRVFIEKEADITFSHSSFFFVEGWKQKGSQYFWIRNKIEPFPSHFLAAVFFARNANLDYDWKQITEISGSTPIFGNTWIITDSGYLLLLPREKVCPTKGSPNSGAVLIRKVKLCYHSGKD